MAVKIQTGTQVKHVSCDVQSGVSQNVIHRKQQTSHKAQMIPVANWCKLVFFNPSFPFAPALVPHGSGYLFPTASQSATMLVIVDDTRKIPGLSIFDKKEREREHII